MNEDAPQGWGGGGGRGGRSREEQERGEACVRATARDSHPLRESVRLDEAVEVVHGIVELGDGWVHRREDARERRDDEAPGQVDENHADDALVAVGRHDVAICGCPIWDLLCVSAP
eukprot:4402294-Prymnesium_polylepis.1